MKRLVIILTVLTTSAVSLFAQGSSDIIGYGQIPLVTATITKNEIPPSVIKAARVQFDKDNPLTWTKFPFELKEYGWVYEVGSTSSDLPLAGFQVTMETDRGNNYKGYYDENGNLVETMERSKDIAIPRYVMEAISKTEFKDWKAIGDKELIQFFHGDKNNPFAQQVFKITLQKGSERKKLTFKYEAGSGKYQAFIGGKNILE